MEKNEKLAVFFGLLAMASGGFVFWQYAEPGTFKNWFITLAFTLSLVCILILVMLVASSESRKIKELSVDKEDFAKRELLYIETIVRNYRKDFLLGQGSVLELINRIVVFDHDALGNICFNAEIAYFLKKQMEEIIEKNKTSPLQEIKGLLAKTNVYEAGDDFGTNQYLFELQAKVIEICGEQIIIAAYAEYNDVCNTHTNVMASAYLDSLNSVEIFRVLGLKTKLLEITKKFEVVK
jgi:hypothetical protein